MLKVGLVGTGISATYYHLPFINENKNFQLCHTLTSKCKSPLSFYCSDFDLAVVTSPNFLHFKQAKLCLEHGKHVLVEKPFTLTLREAEKLYDLAEQKGLTINPYFNRRYDSDFLFIQSQMKDRGTEQVLTFESNLDKFIPERRHTKWKFLDLPGSGLFYDISPHLIDQALLLFGHPTSVFAEIKLLKKTALTCDYFSLSLQYKDKIIHLNSSGHSQTQRERFRLCFPNKTVITHGQDIYDQKAKGLPTPDYYGEVLTSKRVKKKKVFSPASYEEFYQGLYKKISRNQYFIKIEDCLNNVKVMQTLKQSSDKNKLLPYSRV